MSFAQPVLLYALLALPLFALALVIQFRRLFPLLQRLSLQKGAFIKTRCFYFGLFGVLTLAALIIAAAGPSLTVTQWEERARGRDIVFAFDVSRSMNVRDVVHDGKAVTRLEGAKIIARGLLDALRDRADYRYAAAVGKGEGVLAVPLTYRAETVGALIDALSSQAISAAGTNVEKLARAAIGAFPPDLATRHPSEKAVIVFTDGEALSGLFKDAVDKAKEARITVSAVCVGSEAGGPVPTGGWEQGQALYLRDADGKSVVSRADPGALREAVEQGGGFFFAAGGAGGAGDTGTIDAALASLRGAFLPREGGEPDEEREHGDEGVTEMRETEKRQDARFIFAALALVFFALHKGAMWTFAPSGGPNGRPSGGPLGVRKKRAVFALPLLLLSCAPAAPAGPAAPFAAVEAKLRLLEGNFFVTRNMLSEAEASYTRSRALAAPGDIPYALYALGLARLLSEESPEADDAAIALFGQADGLITDAAGGTSGAAAGGFRHGHGERHRELAFRLHYNAGVAQYRAGNAEEAAREFREALLADPGRVEAKRNLEISLLLVESKNALQTSEVKSARPVREGKSRENAVLFDFIRQKEADRWQSQVWQGGGDDSSLDY